MSETALPRLIWLPGQWDTGGMAGQRESPGYGGDLSQQAGREATKRTASRLGDGSQGLGVQDQDSRGEQSEAEESKEWKPRIYF